MKQVTAARQIQLLAATLAIGFGNANLAADPAAMRCDENVMMPMRDGVQLAANVYRNAVDPETPRPVILLRTPYGKPPADWSRAAEFVRGDLHVVAQDCRGRGQSAGTWDPFEADGQDGIDTQKWVADQPWCNGRIGLSGGSYVGWTQWSTAPDATQHVQAMMPVVPFGSAYHDIAYPGGAFQVSLLTGWGAAVGGAQLTPQSVQQAFLHLPLKTLGQQFQPPVPFLNDWVRHHRYDEYWKRRGIDNRFASVTTPILNVGGWYDIFSKATIDLVDRVRDESQDRRVRRNQFVVMGPWTHGVGQRQVGELDFGDDAALDIGALEVKWFQYWLNDIESDVEDWPAYRLFVMGVNRWRGENEWPLQRTVYTPYYFHSDGNANTAGGNGSLSPTAPADEPHDQYEYDGDDPVPTLGGNNLVGAPAGPYDQAAAEQRSDVLVYTSDPLETALEVTGPVRAIIYASSTARDTDFTAKLVDVHPDGKAYNLCDGILRARYRRGLEDETLLQPGEIDAFEIDLWVTSNVFLPGHRVRVEVSSSNFPRFDRNPNSGAPFGDDIELLTATQSVYHDGAHASHIVLPVIPAP